MSFHSHVFNLMQCDSDTCVQKKNPKFVFVILENKMCVYHQK